MGPFANIKIPRSAKSGKTVYMVCANKNALIVKAAPLDMITKVLCLPNLSERLPERKVPITPKNCKTDNAALAYHNENPCPVR